MSVLAPLALAALLLPLSGLAFLNHDAIAFGVRVSDERVGGSSPAAKALLLRRARAYAQREFTFTVGGEEFRITTAATGLTLDGEETWKQAFAVGRGGNIFANIKEQLRAALFGMRLRFAAKIDDRTFETFFEAHLETHENRARDASLGWNEEKGVFETVTERDGTVIDTSKLKYDLLHAGSALRTPTIAVLTVHDEPSIRTSDVEPLVPKANEILENAPVAITYPPEKTVRSKIEKAQLKELLTVRREQAGAVLDVDTNELRSFLVQLAPIVNRKPQNAVLSVTDGKVTEFAISQNGIELDVQESAPAVRDAILQRARTAELSVTAILPEVRTETIENLGLVALLGVGESDFAGSPASRAFNVKLGAQKLNGLLIKPKEEFSFVNAIGDIDPKEGWQSGLVIKGAELVPEYGGGVCQVSTTMFRATVHAGLPVTERFPHSLPVQYYNPQGFDATVYGPHPDFRFVNDTPSNILIQTKVKGTKLSFEFYGTPDGREVKVIGPEEYDKKPDGSLKAVLTREIYRDGALVKKDVFRSSYRSPQKEPQQRNPLE